MNWIECSFWQIVFSSNTSRSNQRSSWVFSRQIYHNDIGLVFPSIALIIRTKVMLFIIDEFHWELEFDRNTETSVLIDLKCWWLVDCNWMNFFFFFFIPWKEKNVLVAKSYSKKISRWLILSRKTCYGREWVMMLHVRHNCNEMNNQLISRRIRWLIFIITLQLWYSIDSTWKMDLFVHWWSMGYLEEI